MNYDDGNIDSTMGNATTRIHSIAYTKNGITQANYIYTYDDNSNITGVTVKNQYNQVVDDYDYYYDGFNQLIRENVYLNSGSFARTYLYFYDDQGNIVSIYDYAYTYYNEITTPPMVITYYEYDNTWKDQLTKITEYTNFVKTQEISYSYDANGNPTTMTNLMNSYQTKTLNWDGRQLSSMSYYCGGMSFKYNDQGIRTYKSIGGCSGGYSVNYVLDGSKILSETKGTSTIYYTYDADGTLISMNYNGNEYFYITNMQGDVVELVDISGNTVVKYKYDAWGNIIYQTPNQPIGDINPFRYRSYYYDIETGWYYLQSRYYNPSIGRFISADGVAGEPGAIPEHNMYAYCTNNPLMATDPSGHAPKWWQWGLSVLAVAGGIALIATGVGGPLGGALIGAGVNSIVSGYINEANGGSFDGGYVGGAISGFVCGLSAGAAGMMYAAAAETTGLAVLGYVGGALITSGVGGYLGGFGGSIATNLIDGREIDIDAAIEQGIIYGTLNLYSGIGSSVVIGLEQEGIRAFAGILAFSIEAVYDAVAYGISRIDEWLSTADEYIDRLKNPSPFAN